MIIALILVVLLNIDLSGFYLTLGTLSLYSRLTTGQYHDIALAIEKYHDIALTAIQHHIYALWRYFDLRHKWATNQPSLTVAASTKGLHVGIIHG